MINHETELLDNLMATYNRHARPIADVLKPIDVSIGFYLTKILGLVGRNKHISRDYKKGSRFINSLISKYSTKVNKSQLAKVNMLINNNNTSVSIFICMQQVS